MEELPVRSPNWWGWRTREVLEWTAGGRGGSPPWTPRPPDKSDHKRKNRNLLQQEKSCRAIFDTQFFGSLPPFVMLDACLDEEGLVVVLEEGGHNFPQGDQFCEGAAVGSVAVFLTELRPGRACTCTLIDRPHS